MTPFQKARQQIQERINDACQKANRDPKTVRLLAASKRTDAQGILNAIDDGHLLFGENRAQSLRDKHLVVQKIHPEAEWHFIGHVQKNKIKYVVGKISMLHSLDSIDLASAINERIIAEKLSPLPVLLQVKLGNEETKTGIPVDHIFEFCERIQEFPQLQLKGLMCIPPLYGQAEEWFGQIQHIAAQGRKQGYPLEELSMGMSDDLEAAITFGSTIIRVGTALFCT